MAARAHEHLAHEQGPGCIYAAARWWPAARWWAPTASAVPLQPSSACRHLTSPATQPTGESLCENTAQKADFGRLQKVLLFSNRVATLRGLISSFARCMHDC